VPVLSIASTVGAGGVNAPTDVRTVLELLRLRQTENWYQGVTAGLKLPQAGDRSAGDTLGAAIRTFQARVQGDAAASGVVTPDGSTILFLGGLHPLGKQIIVDLDDQTLYACDGLKRIYTFDCTSGDEGHPTANKPALFKVLRKEKIYRSKKYDAQMNYALFFSADGKAIHQSHAVWLTSAFKKWGMDYFGSHGCVRLAEDDAQTLFGWAVPQMPVLIDLSRKSFR
jgi:hypothetical protein